MEYIKRRREGTLEIIMISREKRMNALNHQVLNELSMSFDEINTEKTTCVILTGAGEKAFVAGADIAQMEKMTKEEAKEFSAYGAGVFRQIEEFEIPVIAAINGYALGGGFELALACDIRIAAESARFGFPELKFGIIPGFSGTQRIMRAVPIGYAKEMVFGARQIDSHTAYQISLVSKVCTQEELMSQVINMGMDISKNSLYAIKQAKKAMVKGADMPLSEGIRLESKLFSECFETEEQKSRMSDFLKN